MGEYFKPMRRKIGCITLLMACVFVGGWVRSLRIQDAIVVPYGRGSSVQVVSACQCLILVSASDPMSPVSMNKFSWWSESVPSYLGDYYRLRFMEVIPTIKCRRFHPSEFRHSQTSTVANCYHIPYWSIVIPLTLISAFLLLSKPRKSTPTKIIAEKVA